MGAHLLLCALLALLSCPSISEWTGREYALCFMQNYRPRASSPRFQLYISALQSNTKVTVKVPPLNFNQEKTLKAGEVVTISLPTRVEIRGSRRSPNTVRIDASADVSVSSFNYKLYTAESSVIYPVTEWGTEYFIITTRNSHSNEFSVTNGKEKNKVKVFPSTRIQFERRVYGKGSSVVIDLQPYESVQFQGYYDLSDSRVVSQHPVAVFTGHTCTYRFSRCDHVYEQLLPVSKWGSNFIVAPLSVQRHFDSVYIQASQPTRVTVKSDKHEKVLHLRRGHKEEVRLVKSKALSIQADHGIQVLMLFNGVRWSRYKYYDPFLMTILPTNRLCSSYLMQSQQGFESRVLIVAKTSENAELRIDGAPLPRNVLWKKVAGTDFSWTEIIYRQDPGKRRTVSSSGARFAVYNIGLGQRIGYGSPGQCLQPGGGPQSCSTITCSVTEICEMKGGNPSCVPKPVETKPGTC